jgi:hypothetical protein
MQFLAAELTICSVEGGCMLILLELKILKIPVLWPPLVAHVYHFQLRWYISVCSEQEHRLFE